MSNKNTNMSDTDKKSTSKELLDEAWDITKRSARLSVKTGTMAAKYSIYVASRIARLGMEHGVPLMVRGLRTAKNTLGEYMIPFVKDHWKKLLLATIVSSTTYVATDGIMDKYDQWKEMSQKTPVKK